MCFQVVQVYHPIHLGFPFLISLGFASQLLNLHVNHRVGLHALLQTGMAVIPTSVRDKQASLLSHYTIMTFKQSSLTTHIPGTKCDQYLILKPHSFHSCGSNKSACCYIHVWRSQNSLQIFVDIYITYRMIMNVCHGLVHPYIYSSKIMLTTMSVFPPFLHYDNPLLYYTFI